MRRGQDEAALQTLEQLDAYKAKLDKKQQRIDRARARYERMLEPRSPLGRVLAEQGLGQDVLGILTA